MNIAQFETDGQYNIPVLEPYVYEPCEFVGFNYARSAKNKGDKGLHFFVDDYQFERLWREPLAYVNLIGEFHSIMTPDFSLYTDYPKAIQIYNHYRKHWLGALWQSLGTRLFRLLRGAIRTALIGALMEHRKAQPLPFQVLALNEARKKSNYLLTDGMKC